MRFPKGYVHGSYIDEVYFRRASGCQRRARKMFWSTCPVARVKLENCKIRKDVIISSGGRGLQGSK